MKIIPVWKEFLKSEYYNFGIVIGISLSTGLLVALFPFQDLTPSNIFRFPILIVTLEAAFIAGLIITWVMFVSWVLDGKYDWLVATSKRAVYQMLYGGVVSVGIITSVLGMVYGRPLFDIDTFQYLFALQLLLVYLINDRAYMIYLAKRKRNFKKELVIRDEQLRHQAFELQLLTDKNKMQENQLLDLKDQHAAFRSELATYTDSIITLKAELGEKEAMLQQYLMPPQEIAPYTLKIANNERVFLESEIRGFEIDGQLNKKPLIHLHTTTGEKILTSEKGLNKVEKKYPTFPRLNRQLLVAPHAIESYELNGTDGAYVRVNFKEDVVPVSEENWTKIGDKIRIIVAENNNSSSAAS
ncbi:LytTR family transcriptional regulator DNA-binding domain-containing protein [Sphingobacterium pedocola]|uniref:HTH LytTR-type domain-containing protein n=1 Tax=Sphingobacterium pedocola TaxID=2082722 RepID=A0ABR9T3N1_9SPHI|nr:LytTR family transcriptional regulator DNA-binding domain-containing protein [Sphingobacterium pedocola]MBE8719956.1 hypothetical protein [Sphingobacterium pedocola]